MKKHTAVLLLLLLITPCLRAQKKEIAQARSYIKSGKDFDKAENLMTGLLKDSANLNNAKIYLTWYDAVRGLYDAANEKLYLHQKYDTAAFFNLTRRMFDVVESLDSIDATPDQKGRIRPAYRKRHAEELTTLRPNLYYGGTFFVRKADYTTAYRFFDTYLDCEQQPLFSGYHFWDTDSLTAEAAYWATYCGHRLEDAAMTLKYSVLALRDSSKAQYTLQYVAEAFRRRQESAAYLRTLYDGFSRYPEHTYFFPRIIDYYAAEGRQDSALVVADRALQVNPHNELFLFAKSTALLNLGRNEECVSVSEELIGLNDTMAEPYFNVATACLNQALELEQRPDARQLRQQLRELYQHARPYMEAYRKLAPQEQQKWAPALYRIYLNLNMGKQFEEIDQLLKK